MYENNIPSYGISQPEEIMPYEAKIYNVMIASPGDVNEERQIAQQVIMELNALNAERNKIVLLPITWETHSSPGMGSTPQEIINSQVLEKSDILVGIFWSRLGTPTGEFESGTVEEIEKHAASGRITMVYFSSRDVSQSTDFNQFRKVREFKDRLQPRGLRVDFNTPEEFKAKLRNHLQLKINELVKELDQHNNDNAIVAPISTTNKLSSKAIELLTNLVNDPNGRALKLYVLGGSLLQVNGQSFSLMNARERAEIDGAMKDLHKNGFIDIKTTTNSESYQLTREGYEYFESEVCIDNIDQL